MLNEFQLDAVWRDMLAAETRSYYFADLAKRVTTVKQWITGGILVLSSGAAASFLGEHPRLASALSLLITGLTVYTFSAGLDRKALKLQELHASWNRINDDYQRLWSHTYAETAEAELETIRERERQASALAIADLVTDMKRVGKWQDRVNALHSPQGQNAA